MKTKLDAESARKLAEFIASIREWNVVAILKALHEVRNRPLDQIAAAAVRAALDPRIESPVGIAWTDRPHWHPENDAPEMQLRPIRFDDAPGAPPEVAAKYLEQIRDHLRRSPGYVAQPGPQPDQEDQ